LRYLRVGGRGFCLGAGQNSKPEKCLKMPQNPTRQVHALLGGFVQDALINNQNHRHKTDKIIARTLFFSKNQKTVTYQNSCEKILTLFAPSCLLKKDKPYFDQCLDRLDNQTTAETRKYFMLTKTLAKKVRLLLLPKPLPRKNKPILKTYVNQP